MQQDKNFLGTEPVGKLLVKLALPAITAQIINLLYNMVDRIYIGHMPEEGALALTGVGVCMPVIMIVSAFAALVSMGGAPKASIYMGKGEYDEAERVLGNCFVLQLVISAVLTIVLLLWNRQFLMAFGASENTIYYANSYMKIYALGTVFVQLTLGMNAFITAQGFAKTSMASVVIGAVCNIMLDPVFIYGMDMGVQGAALATIISQAISTVWVLSFLIGKKTHLKIRRKYFRLEAGVVFPCMALGLAPFIMQASESVIMVCFNSSLLKYGGDLAVGAMTILTSVMQFSMLPVQGFGQGAQPIISYNFGASKEDRVRKTYKLLLISNLTFTLTLWALVMLFPQLFVKMFTPDKELISFGKWALRIYMAGMGIFGAQMACQTTFVALGNAKASILVAVTRKFFLLLPLIYIMPLLFADKTMAVYLAEPVADVLAVTFTVCLFRGQFKKALQTMREGKTDEKEGTESQS